MFTTSDRNVRYGVVELLQRQGRLHLLMRRGLIDCGFWLVGVYVLRIVGVGCPMSILYKFDCFHYVLFVCRAMPLVCLLVPI
jgi:hypothetical protein